MVNAGLHCLRWSVWSCVLLLGLESASAQNPPPQETIETLPPLRVVSPSSAPPVPEPVGKVLPMSLDAVLRLAQDQNGQLKLARAKLEEAGMRRDLAEKHWLPNITVGPSFYRHEGGIQDFNGNLIRSSYGSIFGGLEIRGKLDLREMTFRKIEAERQMLQRRGELSKLTSDQLLEAATTYIDVLAALTAERVSHETEGKLQDVLVQARKLAEIDPGLAVESTRIEAEVGAQKLIGRRFQEHFQSARLKLLYTLGLDPESELAIMDQITVVSLVDERQSPAELVERALRTGPGIAELCQLLALVDQLHAQANGKKHWLPTMEVTMAEGAFGAGPGSNIAWDNRWDMGVHFRWTLNDLMQRREQQRLLDNQRLQAHLSQQDVRAKLTLGVRQALEEIRGNHDQMTLSQKCVQFAEESYRLSDSRLRENIKGRSPSEVLLAARALFAARLSYLNAVRDYDKAQVRLFVLLGAGCTSCR